MTGESITVQALRKKALELGFDIEPCFVGERVTLLHPRHWVQFEGTGEQVIAFLHGYALGVLHGA